VQEGRKWLFQLKFFSFKSAWIFACAFQFCRKTLSCIFFLTEMHLFGLVAFIVHASIFCLHLSQKQSANQPKKYRGMVYYLIEKHKQTFRHFWRKKNLSEKVTYVPLAQSHSQPYSALGRLIINQPSAVGCPCVKKKRFLYVLMYTQSY